MTGKIENPLRAIWQKKKRQGSEKTLQSFTLLDITEETVHGLVKSNQLRVALLNRIQYSRRRKHNSQLDSRKGQPVLPV